jgi:hypothetical protein
MQDLCEVPTNKIKTEAEDQIENKNKDNIDSNKDDIKTDHKKGNIKKEQGTKNSPRAIHDLIKVPLECMFVTYWNYLGKFHLID